MSEREFSYIPAAVSTVAASGRLGSCPGCGVEMTYAHGLMGTSEPLRCGRCYDDWAFEGKPTVRAAMEAKRDLMFSGIRHLLDRVVWAESA